ncbi:MAG: BrnA antitoxin family protein [Pseudomonadales bacterium]|jgi:uncharacterized protein (DUF4415 family)|nr:BrnA antitoxin family protein [Pseudomonadales bacterium]
MSKPFSSTEKLPANFPKTPEEWEALIAAAPGVDTPQAQAAVDTQWADAVLVPAGGGPKAVREALARRTRGPGKKAARVMTTLRLESGVLDAFRAGGPGWQTRINDALKDWLKTHPAA